MKKVFKWIKLTDTFLFNDLKIKKLRRLAGGDTYTIIYLKMLLLAKNSSGVIEYEGIEKSIEEEIALKIDESLDNVRVTLNYLLSVKLMEMLENTSDIYLPQAEEFVGSESESAERTRKYRERLKQKKQLEIQETVVLELPCNEKTPSHCDGNVTECDDICDISVTGSDKNVTLEKEKEIEIDKEKEKDKDIKKSSTLYSENLKNVIEYYQNNIALITEKSASIIANYLNLFSKDILIYAIDIAVSNKVRNIDYIDGILKKWELSNIKTIDEAIRFTNNIYKKEKKEETTEEQLERLRKEGKL